LRSQVENKEDEMLLYKDRKCENFKNLKKGKAELENLHDDYKFMKY
jgi:hypothetical protein